MGTVPAGFEIHCFLGIKLSVVLVEGFAGDVDDIDFKVVSAINTPEGAIPVGFSHIVAEAPTAFGFHPLQFFTHATVEHNGEKTHEVGFVMDLQERLEFIVGKGEGEALGRGLCVTDNHEIDGVNVFLIDLFVATGRNRQQKHRCQYSKAWGVNINFHFEPHLVSD